MIAVVVSLCGRYVLRVGGVSVAMEGDPCREWLIADKFWTKETLDQAAELINHAVEMVTV